MALHVHTPVLATYEDGADDVGCMGIVPTDRASHGRTNQILADVQINQCINCCLQCLWRGWYTSWLRTEPNDAKNSIHVVIVYLGHNVSRDCGLTNDGLPSPLHPVDGCRLLACAVVATEAENVHAGETLPHTLESILHSLNRKHKPMKFYNDFKQSTHYWPPNCVNTVGKEREEGLAFETMFIPMASLVVALKWMYTSLPETVVCTDFSLA